MANYSFGFIKPFGFTGSYGYAGSLGLAQIMYQTNLGDFIYTTNPDGTIVLDNYGSLGDTYDGLTYSGRGIELGATNDVDIPIHHTLGVENVTNPGNPFTVTAGWYEPRNSSTLSIVANNLNVLADSTLTFGAGTTISTVIGQTYLFSIEVDIGTATTLILRANDSDTTLPGGYVSQSVTSSGAYEYEFTAIGTITDIGVICTDDSVSFSIVSASVKQITNPNSYLTYYDFTDGLVTLGNSVDGGSSKELVDTANSASSWNAYGTNTVANDTDGSIAITYVDNSLGAYVDLTQLGGLSENLVIGKSYLVDFSAKINTGSAIIRVYDGVFNDTALSTTTYQNFSVYIKVTASGQYINTPNISVGEVINIKDISVKEILPISTKYTLNTKTVNNIITHTTPWSASDWARINNNPNLIGKLALETLGATKTIAELDMVMDAGASADSYYMCSEKSGAYLVDSRVAYGAEILSGTYNITGNDNLGVVESPSGVFTSDGTNTVISYIVDSTAPMTMYGEKVATFITISNYSAGNVQVYYNNLTNVSGVLTANGSYGFVGEVKTGGNDSYIVTVSADFVGVISLLSAKQVTAQDIANYASTIRTNADLQNKGIQLTAFETDDAGVPTAYSSNLLQFNGDGRYVDTGISMTDTLTGTFECVAMLRKTGEHKSILGAEGREISLWNNDYLYFKYGSEWGLTNTFTDNALSHILGVVENGLLTGFYVNGVSTTITTGTDSGITANCVIGAKSLTSSRTYFYKDEVGCFKYNTKALTATEVATAYAQAKAIYPTLP